MRHAISPRFAISTLVNMVPRRRVPSTIPNQQTNRRGVVGVAGIVELRAVRDEDGHVALGAELDVTPRGGDAVLEGELAVGGEGHVHEKIDVRRNVPLR